MVCRTAFRSNNTMSQDGSDLKLPATNSEESLSSKYMSSNSNSKCNNNDNTTASAFSASASSSVASQQLPKASDDPSSLRPAELDILCGKNKACVKHPGSVRFRQIIDSYSPRYRRQSKSKYDKMLTIKEIYEKLTETSRFLKLHKKENRWEEITPAAAKDKIGHALRLANQMHAERHPEETKGPSSARRPRSQRSSPPSSPVDIPLTSMNIRMSGPPQDRAAPMDQYPPRAYAPRPSQGHSSYGYSRELHHHWQCHENYSNGNNNGPSNDLYVQQQHVPIGYVVSNGPWNAVYEQQQQQQPAYQNYASTEMLPSTSSALTDERQDSRIGPTSSAGDDFFPLEPITEWDQPSSENEVIASAADILASSYPSFLSDCPSSDAANNNRSYERRNTYPEYQQQRATSSYQHHTMRSNMDDPPEGGVRRDEQSVASTATRHYYPNSYERRQSESYDGESSYYREV